MNNFNQFFERLVKHEKQKVEEELKDKWEKEDSREELLVYSGARLNWIGDFIVNPDIKWEEKELPLDVIQFTGNDSLLINDCEKSPLKFQKIIKNNPELKAEYEKIASFGDEPILVRKAGEPGKFKILDGMHRLIGAALNNQEKIKAYIPLNEDKVLPYCEAHTVYDLIRAYQRHARDEEGEKELYYGLKLLLRSYANTEKLLRERFSKHWVNDDKVQEIIHKVLK